MKKEDIKTIRNRALSKLCYYDERNPDRSMDYAKHPPVPFPRPADCSCDNCFYGRDRMAQDALAIIASIEGEGADPVVHVHTVYDAVGGGYICSGCEQRFTTTPRPAKVLTDEVIARYADQFYGAAQIAVRETLKHLHKLGYFAPAPPVDIERIMEVYDDANEKWLEAWSRVDREFSRRAYFRNRLTNALNTKP